MISETTKREMIACVMAWGALGCMTLAVIVNPWFIVGCFACFAVAMKVL